MAEKFYSGYIGVDEGEMQQVIGVMNLFMSSRGLKVAVKAALVEDGRARIPFGVKVPADHIPAFDADGKPAVPLAMRELERALSGCEVKYSALRPCAENARHLAIAREVEMCDVGQRLELADVKPARAAEGDPFAGFIGLEAQAGVFREIAHAISAYGRSSIENLNVVLMGDPGTGKTATARAFAAYARQIGAADGPFRQVSAENLIAGYVGQTAPRVRGQWEKARGGVLFIDEAYRLSESAGGYGQEAIDTLNELMERDRETIVVCAGYRMKMAGFIGANPGLAHRFGFSIDFPGYDDAQLTEIYLLFARDKDFSVAPQAAAELPATFARLRKDPHFAHARSARSLFDKSVIKQAAQPGTAREITLPALREALDAELTIEQTFRKPVGF